MTAPELPEHWFRRELGRLVSILSRRFGVHRMELCEDAAQTALLQATQSWPSKLPDDPARPETEAYLLVPDVDGKWTVKVTATDGQGMTASDDLDLQVAPDQPPCLGAMDPGVPGGTITVDQARRFEVLSVLDDISGYPKPAPGSTTTTGFHWSLATPDSGGAFVPLGTDAPDVVIDPKRFKVGDQIDLRVEISDAIARTLPCDASKSSCAIDGGTTCFQRQTWHLEIGLAP